MESKTRREPPCTQPCPRMSEVPLCSPSSLIAAVVLFGSLVFVPLCFAVPLQLQMTKDELTEGTAVLLGDLRGAFNQSDDISLQAMVPGVGAPKHWSLSVGLRGSRVAGPVEFDILRIEGRHISNPPPHSGEASPGPLLLIGSGVGNPAYFDLDAVSGQAPAPLVRSTRSQHDLPNHFDIMTSTLIDLDSESQSVLIGASDEVRMRIDFIHTPEPSTVILFGTALVIVMVLKVWRRNAVSMAGVRRNDESAGHPTFLVRHG